MTGLPRHYWILRGLLIVVVLATIAAIAVLVPWRDLLLQYHVVVIDPTPHIVGGIEGTS
jgi:hypothetical protein